MKLIKLCLVLMTLTFLANCNDADSSSSSSGVDEIDLSVTESLPAETEEVGLTSTADLQTAPASLIDGGFLLEGNVIKSVDQTGSTTRVATLPDPSDENLSRSYGSTQAFALSTSDSSSVSALVTPNSVQGFITTYLSSVAFNSRDDQQGIVLSDIEGNVADYNFNDDDVSAISGCAYLNQKIYCVFTNGILNAETFQTCFDHDSQLLVATLAEGSITEITSYEFFTLTNMKNVTGLDFQPGTSNLILSATGDVFCNSEEATGGLAILDVSNILSEEELSLNLIEAPAGLGQSGLSTHNNATVLFSSLNYVSSLHIFDGENIIELELPELLQGATYTTQGVLRGNEILLSASGGPFDASWNRAVSLILSEDLQSIASAELIADLAAFPLNVVRIQENQYMMGSFGNDLLFIGEN